MAKVLPLALPRQRLKRKRQRRKSKPRRLRDWSGEKAKELEVQRKAAQKAAQKVGSYARPEKPPVPESSKLWTVKYAPQTMTQIVGNKTSAEKIAAGFETSARTRSLTLRFVGPDGTGSLEQS